MYVNFEKKPSDYFCIGINANNCRLYELYI